MNKKFTLTFALLSLLAVGNAHADSKLVAVDSPSATTLASFSLSDISKLSFADGKMMVTLSDKTTKEVALNTNLVLKFEDVTTSIAGVTDNASKLQVAFDGNTISVAGLAKAENAAIYSIGGQKVVDLKSWNGSPVNVGSLSNGVYILKVNNKSFKFIKK